MRESLPVAPLQRFCSAPPTGQRELELPTRTPSASDWRNLVTFEDKGTFATFITLRYRNPVLRNEHFTVGASYEDRDVFITGARFWRWFRRIKVFENV